MGGESDQEQVYGDCSWISYRQKLREGLSLEGYDAESLRTLLATKPLSLLFFFFF